VYTFSPYASQIEALTKQAMDDYEKTIITNSSGWQAADMKSRDNYCLADIYIKEFASLCSLSSIQAKMDGLATKPAIVVAKTNETIVIKGAAAPVAAVAAPVVFVATPIPGAPLTTTPLPTTNYEVK